MKHRKLSDCFPNPREQTFVMCLVVIGFAVILCRVLLVNVLHGSMRNVDQTPSLGTVRFIVNINTAGHAELTQLPDIGPKMAQRILDYREANGPFQSISDIKNVRGIGDKTFDAMAMHLAIRNHVAENNTEPTAEVHPTSYARRP